MPAATSHSAGPSPQTAIDYVRGKRLRPSFSWAEAWQQEHAVAFTVAKAMTDDVLTDIKSALEESLKEGGTFQAFKKDLTPALQKKGWWGEKQVVNPAGERVTAQLGSPRRLQIIYDANMRTARAVGQWSRIQSSKDVLPILEYELGPSLHHRPEHAAVAGTRLPADDPWWKIWFPPNGWRCACKARQLSLSEAKARGGISGAPAIDYVSWTNPATGETQQVPDGIEPGWGHNPGEAGLALRQELVKSRGERVSQ